MDYLVRDYGAVGDGIADDAAAIQRAVDACAAAGGGRVVLEGGVYYAGSVRLRENVELHIKQGAVLKAHGELSAYYRPAGGEENGGNRMTGTPVTGKPAYAFLYAKDANRVCISGGGTIDGNAGAFTHRVDSTYVTGMFYPRPTLIYFEHCDHITVKDVFLQNAPFWTLHPAGCDDVLISSIHILNPLDMANSDGIDPDHCSNVRILGCHIECADDCICLKNTAGNREYGPCENIIIANCTLVSTSAALKIGTEGVDDFRHIRVANCVISRSNRGISIQVRDSGSVYDVSFRDISIGTRRFSEHWWGTAEPIAITVSDREEGVPCGSVWDVEFHNISCCGENGALLYAQPGRVARDIRFDNVGVELRDTSRWPKGSYDLRPCRGEARLLGMTAGFCLWGVQDVSLRRCRARLGESMKTQKAEALRQERCRNVSLWEWQASNFD